MPVVIDGDDRIWGPLVPGFPPLTRLMIGDLDGVLAGRRRGSDQSLVLTGDDAHPHLALVGDARALLDHARGGDDELTVTALTMGTGIGDAPELDGHAQGGNDRISVAATNLAFAYGDALFMRGHARGGNDDLSVSTGFGGGAVYGDAFEMFDHAHGGDDLLTHQFRDEILYGDASAMHDHTVGGDDVLLGHAGVGNELVGDAGRLDGHARGGDDRLVGAIGGPAFTGNVMYGDGRELAGRAIGGDDVLVDAAHTSDTMWGDAAVLETGARGGRDVFVFAPENGQDFVMDFQRGGDRIDLSAYDFTGFSDVAPLLQLTPEGLLIDFDTENSVLLAGVTALSARDFLL